MRKAASIAAVAGLLAALPLAAQEPAEQPRVHVVREGETLWDIARNYLSDPFLWPEIFRLNTDVVEDPARIYPTERLVLPDAVGGGEPVAGGPVQRDDGPRVRFGERVVRPEVLSGDFYRAGFIAREADVAAVGLLVDQEFQSVVPNRLPMQINLYDRVFVRVDPSAVRVGDRLHFLHRGREIRPMGRVYTPTAVGTVAAMEGEVATVVIVNLYDQVEIGDVVVPWERFPVAATARSEPVNADLQGKILAFQDQRPLQLTESVLFLDIGSDAGVRIGDVFEAYTARSERDWGTRPEVPVARLQVVKVMGATASVRVTSMRQPNIAVGLPVRRVARMR